MSDYAKFVALAQRLIAKRGRAVSLQRLSDGNVDASKPWNGTGQAIVAEQIDNVPAVFLDAKGGDIKTVIKDDELLKRVSDVVMVAPRDVDLSNMNTVVDGKVMKIEWAQVLKPGDTVCLYVFGVSR